MSVLLWFAQGLLAVLFLGAGLLKLTLSRVKLRTLMGVLDPFPPAAIKAIALAEVLGALGVIVPPLLGRAEGVVPWAAIGLALVMVGAMGAHGRRGEWLRVALNVALFAVAGYVAWSWWRS